MKVQLQHACNTHSSTQSSYSLEYEVSYGTIDQRSSLSPPPCSSSSNLDSATWTHSTTANSPPFRTTQSASSRHHSNNYPNTNNNYHHSSQILHNVMGSSRVTKSISQPYSRTQARYNSQPYHNPHQPIVASQRETPFATQFQLQNGPTPYSSDYRPPSYHVPRSNRLPTLVDRIKAALAVQPSRQHSMHPYSTTDRNYRSNSSQHMAHSPRDYQSSLSSIASKPTPTLYGVKCTEVSQKAYTGQTSAMKAGFKRLQRLDSGKVEYRTIAFCTHLTVSRWETTTPNGNTNNVSTSSSEESAGAASSSSRNNPSHAAQLMSLANYIRHILSLTAGNSNTPPHQGNQPQQHDDSSNKQSISKNNHTPPSTQELHTSSSRSLKVLSNKRQRHRYSPEYHDHGGQRHSRHNQESYDQGYQEGHQHKAPPQFPPQDQNQPQFNNQQSQGTSYRFRSPSNTKASDVLRHFPQPINTSRTSPPLLRVPFPNLTLTLALIYVDRLKAKNPEAKGEPGCSHRLFLIAFIIAAKYRCSVALSPSFSEQETSENSENSLFYDPPVVPEEDDVEEEQSLESRLNSELIFSNHAWVRLLNLGSFARTSPSDTPTHSGSGVEQTLPNSPSGNGPSSPMSTVPSSPQTNDDATSTRASNTPVPTTPTHGQTPSQAQMHPQQLQNFSSIMHSATSGAISSAGSPALQVEDLDRMEAEFLTFLNFDLATMTHDLETCWNLLVGKKD